MPDLGLEVLWKGKNFVRLLGGLWVALRISLIAAGISVVAGILLGRVVSSTASATTSRNTNSTHSRAACSLPCTASRTTSSKAWGAPSPRSKALATKA